MEWIKGDGKAPDFSNSYCLMLSESGLFIYDKSTMPQKVARGIEAIGTGAKAAMCAYEAMGYADPKRAVAIVCKHDSGSRTPVRVYRLKG
jgi:precorrin-6B methylase 1